jgi:hypothetical protein
MLPLEVSYQREINRSWNEKIIYFWLPDLFVALVAGKEELK